MSLIRATLVCAALLCACGLAAAADLIPVPALSTRIVDLSATLSTGQLAQIEATLRAFEERKGSQLAVLILPTTQPEAIEQYALRVAEQWKLGRKKIDDGALLVIAKDDRTVRIEVGYGLEGALNDATAKRIIDDIIVPHFKQGDYDGGVQAGVAAMIKVIDGEALPAVVKQYPPLRITQLLPLALVAAVVLGGVLRLVIGRVPGALVTGAIVGLVAWFIAGLALIALAAAALGFFFTLIGGGRMGGIYMGRGGGGGWGGGGGGGGFSGGGGGFGGGGASGKW